MEGVWRTITMLDIPTYDNFLKPKTDEGERLPNALTQIQIQAPYKNKEKFDLEYGKGDISSLKVDLIKHTAGSYDFGNTTVPNGCAIATSRMFHDIFLLKQGQHNLQIFGRYDQTVATPNVSVNYFRLTYLPLGN